MALMPIATSPPGDHLQVVAQAAVEVSLMEVDVGEMDMVQRTAQKGFYLLIAAQGP